jgi:hypothetical protein
VEDAYDRLLAFHTFAGPEDVPGTDRKAGGAEFEGALKVSRQEAWTRDIEVFADETASFLSDARASRAKIDDKCRPLTDGAPLTEYEHAFVESLLLSRAQQNARAAAIERDMVFARGAALAREVATLESQLREKVAEQERGTDAPPPAPMERTN